MGIGLASGAPMGWGHAPWFRVRSLAASAGPAVLGSGGAWWPRRGKAGRGLAQRATRFVQTSVSATFKSYVLLDEGVKNYVLAFAFAYFNIDRQDNDSKLYVTKLTIQILFTNGVFP